MLARARCAAPAAKATTIPKDRAGLETDSDRRKEKTRRKDKWCIPKIRGREETPCAGADIVKGPMVREKRERMIRDIFEGACGLRSV
jgi:hypothetical protein